MACVSLMVASMLLSLNESIAGCSAPSPSVSSPFTSFHSFFDRSWCRICTFHEAQFASPVSRVTRTLSCSPPVAIVLHTMRKLQSKIWQNSEFITLWHNTVLMFLALLLRSWAHNLLIFYRMFRKSKSEVLMVGWLTRAFTTTFHLRLISN